MLAGNTYTGEFRNNLYNGHGTLCNANGDVLFEGEFRDGRKFIPAGVGSKQYICNVGHASFLDSHGTDVWVWGNGMQRGLTGCIASTNKHCVFITFYTACIVIRLIHRA